MRGSDEHGNESVMQCPLNITEYESSFDCLGYEANELLAIMSFYVFRPATLRQGVERHFGMRSINDFGWAGSRGKSGYQELERKIKKSATMTVFKGVDSGLLPEALEDASIGGSLIDASNPKAVFLWDGSEEADAEGTYDKSNKETKLGCFLRHLRNAIAHSRVYDFHNGFIMLEDVSLKSKETTGRFLIRKEALLDWMRVISAGPSEQN